MRSRWQRFCLLDRRYDDDDGEDRTVGDWRSGPRDNRPPSPPRGDRDRGYDRDGGRRGFDRYEAPRDRGYDRGDRGRWLAACSTFFLTTSYDFRRYIRNVDSTRAFWLGGISTRWPVNFATL